jgi:citrate lyase beta subunit
MTLIDAAKTHLELLGHDNRAFAARYPGEPAARQPVHTVYGGAHLFRAETCQRLGARALASMDRYAADAPTFARAVGFTDEPTLAEQVHARVRAKLVREPVEDFRIDFEDGFGARSDAEEDRVADTAAHELARSLAEGMAPPFVGIRIKPLNDEWKLRATRTLDRFLTSLLEATSGALPSRFVVTLPKITAPAQVRTLVRLFELLEYRHGLAAGSLRLELMIEVAQTLLGADGRSPLAGLLDAAEGRCSGAHFGTYDFTASCNITAAYQAMDHPMCDLAKGLMLLSYAGTGIFLSDGATNVMPVELERGDTLSAAEDAENRRAIHAAWQLGHRHIRHSLRGGFYQGWDLHPAQLPVRFATCYAFFLESFAEAAARLRNFVDKAAQATLVGAVFDDAATGQGLLNYFLRALNSGAIDQADLAITGLTLEEFGRSSFAKILAARTARIAPSG